MKFSLDFSIYYAKDRLEAIKDIDLSNLTPNELETISKYILCGKDLDGTSPLDRKEIYIKTKFSSYQKNKTLSLDEMMESPTFDETLLQSQPNYKKVKPTIDKVKAKSIPGMKELWQQIEHYQKLLDFNEGKIGPENFETPPRELNERELYMLKHFLIELKTQQYYLMDSVYPTIQAQKNRGIYWEPLSEAQLNFPILPCGLCAEPQDPTFLSPFEKQTPNKIWADSELQELQSRGALYLDFRNPTHVYELVLAYKDLELQAEQWPESPIRNLLWTLDFYIDKAALSDQQSFIIDCKKFRMPNKEIARELWEKKHIYHQENYISTIWNRCVKLICEAAELSYEEFLAKDYAKAWKQCNKCGKILLRDQRNFVKKSKAQDGLTSRCKKCDKLLRQGRGA